MVSMDPKEIAIPESIIISLIIVILLSVISSAAEKSIGQIHSSCVIPICAIYILYEMVFFFNKSKFLGLCAVSYQI